MKMWHRKSGDYWYLKAQYCYPGTKVFIHQQGRYYCITLKNDATDTLLPVESSRQTGYAHSGYKWRTLATAKKWAERVAFAQAWLQFAGIVFNGGVTQEEIWTADQPRSETEKT